MNGSSPLAFPPILPECASNKVRVSSYGHVLSTWKVKHETPKRVRFHNAALYRKRELCQAIERELMSVVGIDTYETNELTATVLVHYNPSDSQTPDR